MEIVAVPGSQPLLAIVRVLFRNVDPASDGIGFADAVGATALGHGLAKRHHARAAGNAISGVNVAAKFARGRAIGDDKACRYGRNAPRRP